MKKNLNLSQRGVEDIPGYHFRDDGMAWWKNLRQYCQEFLELHYTSDKLVQDDTELLAFLDEVLYGRVGIHFDSETLSFHRL